MSEYIEREKLLDCIGECPTWTGYFEPYTFEQHIAICTTLNVVRRIINQQPTADVVEVKHGEWIKIKNQFFSRSDGKGGNAVKCSVCGEPSSCSFATPFCSICGAKMDKE